MAIPTKFQFRNEWYSLAPPWLRTGDAERYLYTLQLMTDILLEKQNEAIRFRLPGEGDASQLPYLAFDRALGQGPAEPNDSFVERLKGAFPAWGLAGSARAVLAQVQAYLQGLQPGVAPTYPLASVVGGPYTLAFQHSAKWDQLYQGDAIGALPTHVLSNFNWDGSDTPWRRWLVLYMSLVATGQSGASAATTTAGGGSFTSPGHNVGGVWVPTTSGTPINAPFITITGLSGIVASNLGQWITFTGSGHATNNGTFPIVEVLSATSVVIANPAGVAADAGPLAWSIAEYPFIGPALPWGSPGTTFGEGASSPPPIDTGHTSGGVWQPSTTSIAGLGPVDAWGLDVSPNVVISIRGIVKAWKSARTFYPYIVIAFDGGDGTAGSAYSPNSTPGSGNPDGTFGPVGRNVGGVWVPTRKITSAFDAYCQGTGTWRQCSVQNVT